MGIRPYRQNRSLFSLLALAALILLVAAPSSRALGYSIVAEASTPEGSEQLPPRVVIQTVLSGMIEPVAMAFDPAGRLFYTEKSTGNVRLFANGVLQKEPVITYSVSTCTERGLSGIAIDPNFNSNHYIYVYYTQGPGCNPTENKLERFVEKDGVGSNSVVITSSPEHSLMHNGGNIHFGPDGKLYVSIGDDADWANAQDLTVKNGKIHRINSDGTVPADNPVFTQTGALSTIYAYGLRNSFDFTFDPVVKGRIFATENGPNCDDEMNRIEAGNNYGWRPDYPCDDDNPDAKYNTIAPLWHIGSGSCCEAPTGITVYTGDQIPQWKNQIFMASYNNGALFHFYPNDDRTSITAANIVQGVKANVSIETGPDGALYYIEGGGAQTGTLKRLVGANAGKLLPVAITPPAEPLPGDGSRKFPETGKSVSGVFLDYWNSHGGLAQQGYPISDLMQEVSDLNGKAYTVQFFERAVFEYHPENQPPYNVLLSQLGTLQYKRKYLGADSNPPAQTPNTSGGSVLFSQTGKRLGGKFLDYWNTHGGVAQQGYPISDEFVETSDLNGKPYLVQYFERAVFEMHPENQSPYDVLLSQLGSLGYKLKYGSR